MMSVDDVRRDLALGLGLEFPGAAEALIALRPLCAWDRHSTGETGCEPGAPAEFVVRLRPHCAPVLASGIIIPPAIIPVCQSQQIRLRSRSHETIRCDCGETFPWSHILDFLGPIDEYYPHE